MGEVGGVEYEKDRAVNDTSLAYLHHQLTLINLATLNNWLTIQIPLVVFFISLQSIILVTEGDLCYTRSCHGNTVNWTNRITQFLQGKKLFTFKHERINVSLQAHHCERRCH